MFYLRGTLVHCQFHSLQNAPSHYLELLVSDWSHSSQAAAQEQNYRHLMHLLVSSSDACRSAPDEWSSEQDLCEQYPQKACGMDGDSNTCENNTNTDADNKGRNNGLQSFFVWMLHTRWTKINIKRINHKLLGFKLTLRLGSGKKIKTHHQKVQNLSLPGPAASCFLWHSRTDSQQNPGDPHIQRLHLFLRP